MGIDRGQGTPVSSNPLELDNDDYSSTVVGPQGPKGDDGDITPEYTQMYNDTIAAKNTATSKASEASASASNASTSETNANTSANAASASATSASNSASASATSETNAANSETNAASSATAAASSATSASGSASTATTKASEAATSASTATTKASEAATSASSALTYKNAAESAKTAAETAETNAETAETNAASSATSAASSATSASSSASTATTKASEASTSASNAATSETNAATSETNAATSETNAASSATSASTSATSASTSASTATTKASEAATSATNAASSESAASTSATNAANSATAAASSASNASTSETNAASSATSAATSATNAAASESSVATNASNAATSETNAANSATSASTSASTATTKASEAATSASTATTKASEASTSASNAATSATSAATSATNAAASFDSFDDRYLGSKSSEPTVDNDGDALLTGALYFNSTTNTMKVYSGSSWLDAYATLSGALLTTGGTMTGDLDFNDNVKAKFGASDDLQIYHDGSNSYINDTGTGLLQLRTNGSEVNITGQSGTEFMARFQQDGAVRLYYNNAQKLSTTSSGVDVTGTINADGLILDGNSSSIDFTGTVGSNFINAKQGLKVDIDSDNDQGAVDFTVTHDGGTKNLFNVDESGDISFYENTGSSPKFFWDASAESLGIGTSSPARNLHVHSGGNTDLHLTNSATGAGIGDGASITMASNGTDLYINNRESTGKQLFYIGGSERMRIDASGKVGIGTSSPSYALHVKKNSGSTRILAETAGTTDSSQASIQLKTPTDNWQLVMKPVDSALQFYDGGAGQERMRIDSSGTVIVNNNGSGNGVIKVNGASTSSQNLIFQRGGTEASRIGHSASADLSFYTGSGVNERMRIDSTGKVGIGTSSPDGILDIKGDFEAQKALVFTNTKGTGQTSYIRSHGLNGEALSLYHGGNRMQRWESDGTIKFEGSGSERMRIDSTGKVGIGTSSPTSTLDVEATQDTVANVLSNGSYAAKFSSTTAGDTGRTQGILLSGANANTRGVALLAEAQFSNNAHDFVIATSAASSTPTERMRIDSSGRVGIGTSSPATDLHIKNSGSTQLLLESGNTDTGFLLFGDSGDLNVGSVSYNHSDNSMRFETSDSERMRIDSSGRVGIGTTSPNYLLDAEGASGSISALRVANPDVGLRMSAYTNAYGEIRVETNHPLLFKTNGNNERMRIDSSGRVGIGRTPTGNLLEVADSIKLTSLNTGEGFIGFNANSQKFAMTAADSAAGGVKFEVGTAERMRIDSTGHVLIGKSSVGTGTVGAELRSNGFNAFVRDGGEVMNINRLSSYGVIVDFRKDSSTVGSIGIQSSGLYIDGETNHTGIRFSSAGIVPRLNGTDSDNTNNIGESGLRFKDGHFSGTVNADLLSSNRLSTDYKKIYGISSGQGDNYYFLGSLRVGTQTDGYADIVIHRSVDHGQSETTKTVVNLSQRNGTLSTGCQVYGNLSNGNNLAIKVYQDGNDLDVYLFTDDYAQSVLDITHKGGSSWQTSQGSSVTPTGTEVYDSNDEVQFIINESGKVGIGTSSPDKLLVVEGTSAEIVINDTDSTDTPRLRFRESGTTSGSILTDASSMIFYTGTNERMRINSSGNIGIGTSSPTQKLDVNGTVKATAFVGDGSGLTGISGGGSTGPAFFAKKHVSGSGPPQYITPNTYTKVTFTVEDIDTDSDFTNSRFTPQTAGYYWIHVNLLCACGTGFLKTAIYKNGSLQIESSYYEEQNYSAKGTASGLVYLNGSTDYVEAYVLLQNAPGSSSNASVQLNRSSYFTGFLAR